MDEDNELFNPILRILDRRRAVADCVSEIRLFFDRNRIPIPQDIDDVFNATTQSLDEIIRQAALMQEIGVDQLNQIEGLQTLLGESLDRTNALNQDLIRVRDDFTYERNARRHWETVVQQNQARIAGIQIANLGIRFLNRRKDVQLANQQNQLLPNYDGQEPPDEYYQKLRNINEMARPLAVAGFNAAARCQVMINKMTGRFAPVPANDPYAGGNPAINTELLFFNWLREKYREVMVGTNRGAIFSLVNERFSEVDTPDSYEKRIKPLVQAMANADAIPYLYSHVPDNLEIRIRIAAPVTVEAFLE
ncbi:unnamed protein product [Rhizophagus irregularis]|nr:unnamed protein product [Rhizophagus irregularis]